MSLNYRLVRRPDMRKDAAEGSKLYYAQVRSLKKLKFEKFCNMVAVRSSAFVGDVKLVIDGILSVMEERLEEGDVIQLGTQEGQFYHSLLVIRTGPIPTRDSILIATHTYDTYLRPLNTYDAPRMRFLHVKHVNLP